MTNEEIVVRLGAVLVLGVGAQWLAWRLRLPSILLLLALGFVAGPATGFLKPDEVFGHLLAPLVSLSVAVILFEGGLNLRVSDLPQGGAVVRNLVTVGVAVTWATASLFAYYVMGLRGPARR